MTTVTLTLNTEWEDGHESESPLRRIPDRAQVVGDSVGLYRGPLGVVTTELATSGGGATRLLFVTVLVLPWMLGAVILTWSDGPVKNWAVRLIVSLSFAATLCYTALILTRMAAFLGISPVLCSGPFIAIPMAWYLFLIHMSPRLCPVCEKRSLIPLMQLVITEKRSANTRWCAGCGGKYWKNARVSGRRKSVTRGTTVQKAAREGPTEEPHAIAARYQSRRNGLGGHRGQPRPESGTETDKARRGRSETRLGTILR